MDEIQTDALNITLPVELIKEMDAKCKRTLKRRSEYIKDLILVDLRQNELKLA